MSSQTHANTNNRFKMAFQKIACHCDVAGLAVSPIHDKDGSVYIAVVGFQLGSYRLSSVDIFDAKSGKKVTTFSLPAIHLRQKVRITFAPDASQRLLLITVNETIHAWETLSWTKILCKRHYDGQIQSCAISPRDFLMMFGILSGKIMFYRQEDPGALEYFNAHTSAVTAVTFSHDGNLMASGAEEIILWNAHNFTKVHKFAMEFCIHTIWFPSAPGNYLVTFLANCHILFGLRMTEAGELCADELGNTEQVGIVAKCASFADEEFVFAPEREPFIFRHTKSGIKTLVDYTGEGYYVNFMEAHPNGKQIVFAGDDEEIFVWPICNWSTKNHCFFSKEFQRTVFVLLCVKAHQDKTAQSYGSTLPVEIWLLIFEILACAGREVNKEYEEPLIRYATPSNATVSSSSSLSSSPYTSHHSSPAPSRSPSPSPSTASSSKRSCTSDTVSETTASLSADSSSDSDFEIGSDTELGSDSDLGSGSDTNTDTVEDSSAVESELESDLDASVSSDATSVATSNSSTLSASDSESDSEV